MPDRVGQQFGNYRLVRLLGRGGFAEVYLGQHVRLSSQKAALKILSTQLNQEDNQAFEQEAETIASLIHPHIVRVLDFDIKEGQPFLIMDYAPNGSLRQRHRQGEQLSLAVVSSYIQQIADGLQYAHDHKIIHRDMKPDNMLIGTRDEIVISDFGIATIVHSTTSQSAQAAIGTIPYMAPEQMQEYPRPASDQYALAITVYEWLVGVRPFAGTFTEIAVKHAMVPPLPLRERRPDLPLEVEQVVLTALAKDPRQRFASVRAFARALEDASRTHLFPHVEPPQPVIATQTIRTSTLPAGPFVQTSPPVQPNDDSQRITIENRRSGAVNCVAWSPDSECIASASDDGTVQLWSAGDGTHLFLYPGHADVVDGTVNSIAWSPDGSCIASASNDKTIQVWGAIEGKQYITYRKHTSRIWSVAWSPDSQRLASASADCTVQVWNPLDGRRICRFAGHSGAVYSVAWSPNSLWLASASDDCTVQVWRAMNGQRALYLTHADPITGVVWSPDGQWLAAASDDNNIHVWNATNGARAFICRGHLSPVESVAWSPDGLWLASASDDKAIHIWNAANGARALTYQAHESAVNGVAWSPDSKQIVSAANDGVIHIWQVRIG